MFAIPADSHTQSVRVHETSRTFRDDVARLAPELFGRALRMAASSHWAEDLVQETVLRAIRFETSYQKGTNLRAWLHQILFSVFVTECRKNRRQRRAIVALKADPCAWTLPEQSAPGVCLSPPVARALRNLPPGFRDAIVLVDIEDRSYKDAAAVLSVPVGTIMSRLHRARRALAEAMRESMGAVGAEAA